MSNHLSIRPEDILPDGVDTALIDGKSIRKGTIAAFLANADIFEHPNSTDKQKEEAIKAMNELAPVVIAVGLHRHVVFKNKEIEQILVAAE
ncbi:hypothetical protein Lche_0928 [Legionella cherrii]|uniref:Uncharacterized protein n=1 Tax=Legionella cherrii TaxID=28084 RepID=A0A0W0S5S2_9GAMM|nr:hypothetical protein [Legionella cherrii]KTC78908.1 hypothetical protein Lche_0928 [Legionella cherrii]